ncbi:MAG: ABC transporter ATP-binding protein [Deltaproteobacteria bacterium]|nr:ABC transporter ATP-binding protein [Deltaproteobacteria bacterium]
MIRVRGLGKRYKRYPNSWARLGEWLSGGRWQPYTERWVLRDVSFSVAPGEAVAIVGANGAGKSTLLKILAGTTQPSTGSFAIDGRAAALLELGLGFHADFSGTQNAVMGCQMLGLPAEQIPALLPAIADFAELHEWMDQPLRSYSTGMQMRLAFSVASAVRPAVLIVDEALAVGDAYFQHKCTQRIRTYRDAGTTLLLVSHDPVAVKSLCDRVVLLDGGRLLRQGAPADVLDYYNALIAERENAAGILQQSSGAGATETRSGNGQARFTAVLLVDAGGRGRQTYQVGEMLRVVCELDAHAALDAPTIGLLIRDRLGNDVFGTNTFHLRCSPDAVAAGEHLAVTFRLPLTLGPGTYSISVAAHAGSIHRTGNFDWWDRAAVFTVVPGNEAHFIGTAQLPVEVAIARRPPP